MTAAAGKGGTVVTLQNRVDPFGDIHSVAARGAFTGNRGIIHDPATRTLTRRRWTTTAWICCALDWKGKRRDVMGRNTRNGGAGWTELFFVDEATALAAGHRPCFTCRREAARRFFACLAADFDGVPNAKAVDARLHRERLASGGKPMPLSPLDLADLPDGTMISAVEAASRRAYLLSEGRALPWSFAGYGAPVVRDTLPAPALITPRTSVMALKRGYGAG